jgi:hypothetical protein
MRAEYGAVQEKYQAPWNGGSWAASLGNRKWLATSTMCLNGNPVQTMSLGAKCSPKNKIHTENGVSAFKEKKREDEYVMCAVLPKHQDPLPCSSFGGFSWYESLVAFAFSSSSLLYPTTKFVFPKLAKILAMAPVCLPRPQKSTLYQKAETNTKCLFFQGGSSSYKAFTPSSQSRSSLHLISNINFQKDQIYASMAPVCPPAPRSGFHSKMAIRKDYVCSSNKLSSSFKVVDFFLSLPF